MVPFSNGAFVSWNLYPEVKVSIDSRYEVAYPSGSIEESFDFYDAKAGWQETLDAHGTDAVLVPKFQTNLWQTQIARGLAFVLLRQNVLHFHETKILWRARHC